MMTEAELKSHVTPHWPLEAVRALAAEYAAGTRTREIARRIKRGQAALIGKANRMGLIHPNQPIRRGAQSDDR